jgi:DNA polymerase III subunit gamma/tau
MADTKATPVSLDGVTSLYRRFRPGRFAELRGQDHVVRALQGAVKNDRVSHAYLFSGPRGTGKTTTARILAKALNCENPVDGDACGVCESCIAISKGTSLDVIELDAASNNGVDDIREIISGAWHNTPGRWKVYIFDEVHQLSKAASAALLKTLEEPPGHVVFVLATTDPHKVLPTIRSRTQHLEFRLISADTLATLLQDVRGAAELGADDATIEAAVRLGRGSARDALSALDQLLATGSITETQPEFDGLFGALVNADAVAALRSLAELAREGWDPEQLAESFAGEVRQAFLLQVAPEVADAIDADRERLARWGEQLGLARTVRILETVGRAIREMKSAPEKIVMLEVAMVRLTKPELDHSYESLDERLVRLERGAPRTASEPSTPAPAPLRPIGSTVASPASTQMSTPAPAPPAPSQDQPNVTPTPRAAPSEPVSASPEVERTPGGALTLSEVRERFSDRVVPRTPRSAQLLLRSAKVEALEGLLLTIAVPTEEMRENTELIAQGLKAALEHEFKMSLIVQWTVDPTLEVSPAPTRRATPKSAAVEEEYIDRTDIEVADDVMVVDSVVSHLITEAFPGAEEIS